MTYVLSGIEDPAVAVQGDPVVALIAQVNRFVGKSRGVGSVPFPLASSLDDSFIGTKLATSAIIIALQRIDAAPLMLQDHKHKRQLSDALTNPVPYVRAHLNQLTTTIAQFGDSKGLAPAAVGITKADPRFTPKFPIKTVALLGGLAVVAFVISRGR